MKMNAIFGSTLRIDFLRKIIDKLIVLVSQIKKKSELSTLEIKFFHLYICLVFNELFMVISFLNFNI